MSVKFAVKKIECDNYSQILTKSREAETEWLCALLSRAKVPTIMINKALTDVEYSKSAWRNYLFDTYGLIIINNISSKKVAVSKIDTETGDKRIIGEWSPPEIVKIAGTARYELNLKYWQIL